MKTFNFLLCFFLICIYSSYIESIGNKGMTWSLTNHDSVLNLDTVGCSGCNAYQGDTPCSNKLPILCVSTCGFTRPPYDSPPCPTCAMPKEFYNGCSHGMFLLTPPIVGSSLLSAINMNQICQKQFGTSFTAASHGLGK